MGVPEGSSGGATLQGPQHHQQASHRRTAGVAEVTAHAVALLGPVATEYAGKVDQGSEWPGRLEHRLDNEAVVNKYNADDALYTDYERCVYADPDICTRLLEKPVF